MKSLSKYPFIAGVNCIKAIYLHYKNPELKSEPSEEQKLLFAKASEVGVKGRKIYDEGFDISRGGEIQGRALLEATAHALQSNEQIFYEAAFESADEKFMCIADIFVRSERSISVIEVKSSTKIKTPQHILDIGIQYRVLRDHPEFKKMRFYIAYIDIEYERDQELDYEKLFHLKDVTRQAADVQAIIDKYLYLFDAALAKPSTPAISVGKHCSKPYQCPFYQHCWKDVPEHSVLNLGLSNDALERLEEQGIKDIKELPADANLTKDQWTLVEGQLQRNTKINTKKIQEFLATLELNNEIFFMDFESMMPAIPLYKGTTPYQQICFQYCVIHYDAYWSNPQRREFLAEPGHDPRLLFLENLMRDTKGTGKIVVYNKTFEQTRLRELARAFPEYNDAIENRIGRIIDLMEPFAKRFYYHYSFRKQYSIKVVLPVLCPEHENAYKGLEIRNGSIAMNKYEKLHLMSSLERVATKLALKEYCFTDVIAMVKIIGALERLVFQNN